MEQEYEEMNTKNYPKCPAFTETDLKFYNRFGFCDLEKGRICTGYLNHTGDCIYGEGRYEEIIKKMFK